ncbi:MAG: methylcrotonoyl-CoA carboxylase [Blastocatellia bacterium]|nr:methylcrotonoyl-CoA carboxylase [Blastocatellia bacterium]
MLIPSQIQTDSEDFQKNYAANRLLCDELAERLDLVRKGGGEKIAQKFKARKKLLPRERVEMLLDPGSPFLELASLAAWDMYDNESPGASHIDGIGVVNGVECMIMGNDATVKGGAFYPMSVTKSLRCQQIALENRLPTIYLVESAGANLLHQAELFADSGGRGFANQARMSAAGIPQIALVFGSCTAGGAYVPGLSDYTVMVRKQAKVFLAGPPLVKAATGEEVDDETLGGADMHGKISGLSDYTANDDVDAVRIGRAIVKYLNWSKITPPNWQEPEEPEYDPDELLGIIPTDLRRPFPVREIIARIVDGSRFHEFKRDYAPTIVTGFAHLNGYQIGIVANNGVLFSESAHKATQFIQLCNQARVPILYLQNVPGFMVGSKVEREGIVKHGSKLVNAVANSSVPQLTVIIGGSYGAGNYGMCGRGFDPTLLFSWPNSRIAVMGGEQAAGVLVSVQKAALKLKGIEPDHERLELMRQEIVKKFERESSPYYATARLWDDGVIDPRTTRRVLSTAVSMAYNRDFITEKAPRYGVFRM